MKKLSICVMLVVALSCAGAQAGIVNYDFETGLQGWTNVAPPATENMTTRKANDGTWGTRIGSHNGGLYCVVEEIDNPRDDDPTVKLLASPAFQIGAGTEVSAWTLGGVGGTATPTWSNIADVPAAATAGDFMGIALRRVSDGEYLLFDRRSGSGQIGRTPNWLELGWDAATIATAVAGDAAGETYTVDLIDTYSGGWGWIAMDDVTIVPEPATLTLLGIASVFALRKRRS